jgi:hypothetical protein
MQLHCPRCGRTIPGKDIDLERGVGVCRPCGEIVPFAAGAGATALAKAYKPEGLRLDESVEAGVYQALLRPNRAAAVSLLAFAAVWDGFLFFWYSTAIASHAWGMTLFPVLHLGAGFFITHKALVALLNTRRIHIGDGRVRVTNGPVPAGGTLDRAVDDVDGFSVVQTSTSRSVSYGVRVNLADGTSKKLDVGTTDKGACDYVAASLNDALGRWKPTSEAREPYRD